MRLTPDQLGALLVVALLLTLGLARLIIWLDDRWLDRHAEQAEADARVALEIGPRERLELCEVHVGRLGPIGDADLGGGEP